MSLRHWASAAVDLATLPLSTTASSSVLRGLTRAHPPLSPLSPSAVSLSTTQMPPLSASRLLSLTSRRTIYKPSRSKSECQRLSVLANAIVPPSLAVQNQLVNNLLGSDDRRLLGSASSSRAAATIGNNSSRTEDLPGEAKREEKGRKEAGKGGGEKAEEGKESGPWLVVGLGNPGDKYRDTRHNIGFHIIDAIAERHGIPLTAMQSRAVVGKGRIEGVPLLLAKPQTYMNLSGESVGQLSRFYKIPPSRVLVVYDDMDLDLASLKLLAKGGHGGHNGMKSIIQHFGGTKEFPRLRFGVGRPPGKMDGKVHVLQRFGKKEMDEVDIAVERCLDAIVMLASQGLDRTVSQWNQPRRYTELLR